MATTRSRTWVVVRTKSRKSCRPSWVQTQPLYPTNYSFTTKSGLNLSALVFGDHASPALSPTAVIDNGQPGYSETGSWSTVLGGFNGTNRAAKTTNGKAATATAAWNFTGLATGQYYVYITYAGKSTLRDSGSVQRVRFRHDPRNGIDQRVNPGDPEPGWPGAGELRRGRLARAR